MQQWKILMLRTLRLVLNIGYDRLQELANQHLTIRQILGHSIGLDWTYYQLQTLKDNLSLFILELLDRINQEVVQARQVIIMGLKLKDLLLIPHLAGHLNLA